MDRSGAAFTASRLGEGSEARGRLRGAGAIDVHGVLRGEIDWKGKVVVGPRGLLEADGRVESLELRGALEGRVEIEREAFVRRGARWSGAGVAPALTTEAGCWLTGEFRVVPPGAPAAD